MTLLAEPPRVAVITISDGVAAGTRQDVSGPAIREWALAHGFTVASEQVVPDERERIAAALTEVADTGAADVVITTGGTGLTARDVTPEATRAIITRDVPGLGEQIRAAGLAHTPYAALSRGITGVRASTLVINLPGSTGGVRDGLRVLDDVIVHAVQLLRGVDTGRH